MSDKIRSAPDVPYRPAGVGMGLNRHCMGCGRWSSVLGGEGSGVRYRCVRCADAARVARAAA